MYYWVLLGFTVFYRVSLCFTRYNWVLLGFPRIQYVLLVFWLLLGFTQFYLVLLVLTGLYWVFRGFNMFCWVFTGFLLGYNGFREVWATRTDSISGALIAKRKPRSMMVLLFEWIANGFCWFDFLERWRRAQLWGVFGAQVDVGEALRPGGHRDPDPGHEGHHRQVERAGRRVDHHGHAAPRPPQRPRQRLPQAARADLFPVQRPRGRRRRPCPAFLTVFPFVPSFFLSFTLSFLLFFFTFFLLSFYLSKFLSFSVFKTVVFGFFV